MWVDIGITVFNVLVAGLFVLSLAGLLTWVERKQSAVMQDRIGANRADLFGWDPKLLRPIRRLGLFHPIADGLKMFLKEDYIPPEANKLLFSLAPFLSLFCGLIAFAVIPFCDKFQVWGKTVSVQVASLDIGVLYIFAALSMGIYGVFLAGYTSKNNWAYLGALRASALMLSSEIAIGVSIIGVVMLYGSMEIGDIVRAQQAGPHDLLFGFLPKWGIVMQPLGFLLFLTAGIAATKRIPFDMPEGESEIIGYFVEYSGMKFGMFMMTDFVETIVVAGLTAALFLGGWHIPYFYPAHTGGWITVLQVLVFMLKVCFLCWFMVLVRWTLPRFRYDQAMRLGWMGLFPLAIANIVVTGIMIVMSNG
ncbi:MAG: NADH-quinone oxidoreductase subunit H [Armatimonadetes bacterium]|nr:NADH-quinone oxidoreductase subunit H [Armatimonadota bacterium]